MFLTKFRTDFEILCRIFDNTSEFNQKLVTHRTSRFLKCKIFCKFKTLKYASLFKAGPTEPGRIKQNLKNHTIYLFLPLFLKCVLLRVSHTPDHKLQLVPLPKRKARKSLQKVPVGRVAVMTTCANRGEMFGRGKKNVVCAPILLSPSSDHNTVVMKAVEEVEMREGGIIAKSKN